MNEFNQPVAKDDFTFSHGKALTDFECLRPNWLIAAQISEPVLPEVSGTTEQVHSTLFDRGVEYFGIGQRKIDWREDIKKLSSYERGDVFMMLRYTIDACCSAMPPFLVQQKPLVHCIERPFLPRLPREPLVLRQRFDAIRTVRIGANGSAIVGIADPLAYNQFGKRKLLVG